jgi:hypothetical protein
MTIGNARSLPARARFSASFNCERNGASRICGWRRGVFPPMAATDSGSAEQSYGLTDHRRQAGARTDDEPLSEGERCHLQQ